MPAPSSAPASAPPAAPMSVKPPIWGLDRSIFVEREPARTADGAAEHPSNDRSRLLETAPRRRGQAHGGSGGRQRVARLCREREAPVIHVAESKKKLQPPVASGACAGQCSCRNETRGGARLDQNGSLQLGVGDAFAAGARFDVLEEHGDRLAHRKFVPGEQGSVSV